MFRGMTMFVCDNCGYRFLFPQQDLPGHMEEHR